ncbi:class I SAM-dependent methyltransferase [Pseudomonas putida]|uniref:Class I SAM-dependent methyltransferase n=1 Tax=Pseudomonas putida TaxID=303 RepID=A0A8I1JIK2_PSEPU|nr:class I SAM-dependent methyltransferase [Pseudomonas putida]MBI6883058.1 class I SAM-dependent methyltransferase [Pseudomonas putida]
MKRHSVSPTARRLDQYFTAAWVAEALVRKHFSGLTSNDLVCEPMCGPGRFLEPIPSHVPAFGIELDPVQAQIARERTGRQIITGDIRDIDIPGRPTVFLGNPPFKTALFDTFLEKARLSMDTAGRVGMILPAYFFQTASRVSRYSDQWSLYQEMIPRNIYPGLEKPLCFAIFTKDQRRLLIGFSLFHEQAFIDQLPTDVQEALVEGPSTWPSLVLQAIDEHGGEAGLGQIYEYVSNRRPTSNPHWKEQVRKICQLRAQRTGRGRYSRSASKLTA